MMEEKERALATIRVISDITPIEGADAIELAIVDGWQCVVKKGEYRVGDTIVYFEIDSFLPVREEFEFLRKSSYRLLKSGNEGFRIKTIKLRGQISQGLVMPISILDFDYKIGDDITNRLGVTKWEMNVPVSLSGDAIGSFPEFIRKTDQERVQNLKEKDMIHLRGHSYVLEEKLDGTSYTIFVNKHKENPAYDQIGICSRNLLLDFEKDNARSQLLNSYGDFFSAIYNMRIQNIAIQGEMIGPGIQGNIYGLKVHELFVFDVWDIDKQAYWDRNTVDGYIYDLNKFLKRELKVVPHLGVIKYSQDATLDEIRKNAIAIADGKSKLNNNTNREGIVFKQESNNGYRKFSFKAISNLFLLGEKD